MVGLRKGTCYTKLERAYTRKSKFKGKGYIKSMPHHKIQRFEMGDKTKKYSHRVRLIARGSLQIRHNSIESARMIINRQLQRHLANNYFLRIMVYPHHALRENKILSGGHVDRIQKVMGHPFGKVIGVAAQVKSGKEIFVAHVNKDALDITKKAFKGAFSRLAGTYSIEVESNSN